LKAFGRLREALARIWERRGLVVPGAALWRATGEPHPPGFEKLEYYYKTDGMVFRAVEMLAGMVAGAGYYTTVENPADPEQAEAKRLVDSFGEQVNLDSLLFEVAKDLLIYGNSFLERVFREQRLAGLKRLPPASVRVIRNPYGEVEGYRQQLAGLTITFRPREIVHFKWNVAGTEAYGLGIIYPITRLLEVKAKALEDMGLILRRYASPRVIWRVPSRADAERLKEVLEQLKPDQDPITTGNIEVKPIPVDPRARFEYYFNMVERQIFEGLGAPLLSWLRNATEASARTMLEAVDREVRMLQRYIKRKVEGEIFRILVEAEGFRYVPRLNWGSPKAGVERLRLQDLVRLVETGVLTRKQALTMLRLLGIPIPEEG